MTRRLVTLGAGLALSACFVDLYLMSQPDGDDLLEIPGGTLELIAVRVLVAELAVDGDGPSGSLSQTVPGTFDIDVLAETSTPAYPTFYLEAGTWESVSFSVELDDSVPGRHALELEGIFYPADGSVARSVLVEFDSGEVFSLTRDAPFALDEPRSLDATEVFDPQRWFVGLNLGNASVSEGEIVISVNENVALFEQLSLALDQSMEGILED
jgi:hypothetical protein